MSKNALKTVLLLGGLTALLLAGGELIGGRQGLYIGLAMSVLMNFASYFLPELEDLRSLEEDGLVEIEADWLVVTPKGRLLVRIVCMIFDRYLREGSRWAGYSKVL